MLALSNKLEKWLTVVAHVEGSIVFAATPMEKTQSSSLRLDGPTSQFESQEGSIVFTATPLLEKTHIRPPVPVPRLQLTTRKLVPAESANCRHMVRTAAHHRESWDSIPRLVKLPITALVCEIWEQNWQLYHLFSFFNFCFFFPVANT